MLRPRSRRFGTLTTLLAAGILMTTAQACTPADAMPVRGGTVDSPGLHDAYRSPEALARVALDAMMAGDFDALWALKIDREEFMEVVWPGMPEYSTGRPDFYWGYTLLRSRKGARTWSNEYVGAPLELVSVTFDTEPEDFGPFTIHPNTVMRVRRLTDGREADLRVLDALLEWNGLWKVYNFEED